jgi:hypothetical protein
MRQFVFVPFTKYYRDNQKEEDIRREMLKDCWLENIKGREIWKDIGVDGREILN